MYLEAEISPLDFNRLSADIQAALDRAAADGPTVYSGHLKDVSRDH
jgi:hypothetical protein